MAEPVTLALIGCGGMMGEHVKRLRLLWEAGLRDFRIVATCDCDEPRAAKMADDVADLQGSRPTVYGDVAVMLGVEKNLEAVDIVTVHSAHHTIAEQCFAAGKHVTLEKPLALTMRAGKAILAAAEKAGTVFQVAEDYRRSPNHRAVNWALRSGRIGQVRMMLWLDAGERRNFWGWRHQRMLSGGGWVLDGGVHFADLFRYHVGEVNTLFAVSKAYDPVRFKDREKLSDQVQATVEDTTIAVLDFENGVTGQWTSSMVAPGHKAGLRALYGSEGAIVWGDGLVLRDSRISMEELVKEHAAALSPEEKELLFPKGITDTIAIELQEFFDALLRGRKIETDGVEGLKDEAISIAVYESAALGQPVEVSKVESGEIDAYQAELNASMGI